MAFLLGGKKPSKLAKSLSEALLKFDEAAALNNDFGDEKHQGAMPGSPKSVSSKKDINKTTSILSDMYVMLYGEVDGEAKPDNVKKLIPELINEDNRLLIRMLQHLGDFELSARKHVEKICCWIIKRGKQNSAVTYFENHPEIFDILMRGYESDIALQCGPIIRACIEHRELCVALLQSEHFYKFFEFMQNDNFDIASDAFDTFKLLLTRHKTTSSKFLDANYNEVLIQRYNTDLLVSDNFVTRRESLQLLYQIFKEPKCHKIMKRYIEDPNNLKLIMKRFKEKSVVMQYAVFHVFKFFVANNQQPPQITRILYLNREKLIHLLNGLTKEDARFLEEKELLLECLQNLERPKSDDEEEEVKSGSVSPTDKSSSPPSSSSPATS